MMDKIKRWPHLAIIGVFCLVLGAGAALLWFRHGQQTVEASALPNAARIDRVNGEVGLNRGLDDSDTNTQWVSAEQNTPISVGDRIYTKDNSDASVAFTGRNFARLNADTSLDVLSLSDEKTQVALRDGSGVFDMGSLPSGDLFEVATPCGAVDLTAPGLYQIEINNSGNATATALAGEAQVVSQAGSGRIEKGEVLTLPCDGSSGAAVSRVEPRTAGTAVDQYYRYRYPRSYDGRYASYESYLEDPFYYDPYRRLASYQYVSDDIPGVDDLDYYGDWQNVSEYGECWRPRVDAGWAPYQSGYWTTDYPYGLTWISTEPWGYAPYHYGRWTSVSNQWFWVPERVRTRSVYSPALVAFIPFGQRETIGWVPLGPGDPYAPRYYDRNWSPRYLTRSRVNEERVINLNVPGAVTVVNLRDFNRPIDRRMTVRLDNQELMRAHPVLDPFSVRNFRDAAVRSREAQRRFDMSPALAQRMTRPVVTSTTPITPLRRDLAQSLHVQSVPAGKRGERFQVRDNRQVRSGSPTAPTTTDQGNVAAEQARERQIANLSREASRGNRAAPNQMQQLQQQQRQERQALPQAATQPRAERKAVQQIQGRAIPNNAATANRPAAPQPRPPAIDQRPLRGNRERRYTRNEGGSSPQASRQTTMQRQAPRAAGQNMRQQQPRTEPRGNVMPSIRQRANVQPQPRPNVRQRPEQMRQVRQTQPPKSPPPAPRSPVQTRQQTQPQQQKNQRRGPPTGN